MQASRIVGLDEYPVTVVYLEYVSLLDGYSLRGRITWVNFLGVISLDGRVSRSSVAFALVTKTRVWQEREKFHLQRKPVANPALGAGARISVDRPLVQSLWADDAKGRGSIRPLISHPGPLFRANANAWIPTSADVSPVLSLLFSSAWNAGETAIVPLISPS